MVLFLLIQIFHEKNINYFLSVFKYDALKGISTNGKGGKYKRNCARLYSGAYKENGLKIIIKNRAMKNYLPIFVTEKKICKLANAY